MLFLRRAANENLTLLTPKGRWDIHVLSVDEERSRLGFTVSGPGVPDQRLHLYRGENYNVPNTAILVKFSHILKYDRYPTAASIGIEAPVNVAIYRTERLAGLGPDQIRALTRPGRKSCA